MEDPAVGRQLRALRVASGRTVASVAEDAGLSVPYIANLENGRGNPTLAALTRLAAALGRELMVDLLPAGDTAVQPGPALPASLTRIARTPRFQRAAAAIAAAARPRDDGAARTDGAARPHDDAAVDTRDAAARTPDAAQFSAGLLVSLAALAASAGMEPAEADWWRLVDALLLISATS